MGLVLLEQHLDWLDFTNAVRVCGDITNSDTMICRKNLANLISKLVSYLTDVNVAVMYLVMACSWNRQDHVLWLSLDLCTWRRVAPALDQPQYGCKIHWSATRLVVLRSSYNQIHWQGPDKVLLCYVYTTSKPPPDWLVKIDYRYISISKVTDQFGDQVCQILPAYHSIAGYNTSLYTHDIGKIKPIKMLLQQDKSHFLSEIERLVN